MRRLVQLLRNLYIAGRLSEITLDQLVTGGIITPAERSFIVAPD